VRFILFVFRDRAYAHALHVSETDRQDLKWFSRRAGRHYANVASLAVLTPCIVFAASTLEHRRHHPATTII
jgi:hypothetical protein